MTTTVAPVPPPARYYEHLRTAQRAVERAWGRADRALETAQADLTQLERSRLIGAVEQADQALFSLADAERYRVRNLDSVPPAAREYAVQAARDIELGTRALRRATVLVGDPELSSDAGSREMAIWSIGEGARQLRSAGWMLEDALDLAPGAQSRIPFPRDGRDVPPPTRAAFRAQPCL